MKVRVWGGIAVGLLLLCLGLIAILAFRGVAHDSKAAGSNPQAVATAWPIKKAVAAGDWNLQVGDVQLLGERLDWSQYNTITARGTFLVVRVDMRNAGTAEARPTTEDFTVIDSTGRTYRHTEAAGGTVYSSYVGGRSLRERVPPGVSVSYYLVFDIDQDAHGLRLIFNQGDKPVFDLGQ